LALITFWKSTSPTSLSASAASTFAPCPSTRRLGVAITVTSVVGFPAERSVTAKAGNPDTGTSRVSTPGARPASATAFLIAAVTSLPGP
jgi:hypothetical protein